MIVIHRRAYLHWLRVKDCTDHKLPVYLTCHLAVAPVLDVCVHTSIPIYTYYYELVLSFDSVVDGWVPISCRLYRVLILLPRHWRKLKSCKIVVLLLWSLENSSMTDYTWQCLNSAYTVNHVLIIRPHEKICLFPVSWPTPSKWGRVHLKKNFFAHVTNASARTWFQLQVTSWNSKK